MHPTRIFKTEGDLLKVWQDYKSDLKERAKEWPKIQYVGKDGKRVTDFPVLPLTFEGFKRYCWDNNIGTVEHYFVNKDDLYNDFGSICLRIKNEIREHQIVGGMNGFFNPSITQRLNGLAEKTENKNTEVVKVLNIDPLDDSSDNKST